MTGPALLSAATDNAAAIAAARLGRGICLGNALDGPSEGAWGVTLEESFFATIRAAGFDSVVIPVRWSAHADKAAPYRIDPAFLARVDWAVDQGRRNHLAVLLKTHQYEFGTRPMRDLPRYLAIWEQLAEHYRGRPADVLFEISNDPGYVFTGPQWNQITADVLKIIRRANPSRTVVVCPVFGDPVGDLAQLELPADDQNLLVRLYYFAPIEFTEQGANWIAGADHWVGRTWQGTEAERRAVAADFDRAAQWAREHGRSLYLGEFGAVNTADMESRVRWTRCVVEEAKRRDIPWAYWEFCSNFGVYDLGTRAWRQPLLEAFGLRE
jgi:endoglucanase